MEMLDSASAEGSFKTTPSTKNTNSCAPEATRSAHLGAANVASLAMIFPTLDHQVLATVKDAFEAKSPTEEAALYAPDALADDEVTASPVSVDKQGDLENTGTCAEVDSPLSASQASVSDNSDCSPGESNANMSINSTNLHTNDATAFDEKPDTVEAGEPEHFFAKEHAELATAADALSEIFSKPKNLMDLPGEIVEAIASAVVEDDLCAFHDYKRMMFFSPGEVYQVPKFTSTQLACTNHIFEALCIRQADMARRFFFKAGGSFTYNLFGYPVKVYHPYLDQDWDQSWVIQKQDAYFDMVQAEKKARKGDEACIPPPGAYRVIHGHSLISLVSAMAHKQA